MWNRTFSQECFGSFYDKYHASNQLKQVLERTNCSRLVIGHTPQVRPPASLFLVSLAGLLAATAGTTKCAVVLFTGSPNVRFFGDFPDSFACVLAAAKGPELRVRWQGLACGRRHVLWSPQCTATGTKPCACVVGLHLVDHTVAISNMLLESTKEDTSLISRAMVCVCTIDLD